MALRQGYCEREDESVKMNLGAAEAGDPDTPDFLNVTVGKLPPVSLEGAEAAESDGTYRQPTVVLLATVDNAIIDSEQLQVTLTDERSMAEFHGTTKDGQAIDGSIDCG
jgi:hypothetical protein